MKKNFFLIPLILAVLVLSGCLSLVPKNIETVQVSGQTKNDNVEIYVTSMDKDTLGERFGRVNNPFIAPIMLITPRYFHIFSVTITANSPVLIRTDTIELFTESKSYTPESVQSFIRFWQTNGSDDTPADRKKLVEKEKLIRQYLLPDRFQLQAGESFSGYIVYLTSTPSIVPVKMVIPSPSPQVITF